MKRLMLLVAAGSLWLFLAAVPALADGGPHVSSVNSGTSSLTADSCAGCHRAHTAQGEYLLAATSEEALCLSCHGAGIGAGATTDVEAGIQYVPTGSGTASAVVLGALRDGGFITARIGSDSATRVAYPRSATDISQRPKVPAAAAGSAVTSAHIALAAGVQSQGRVWGSGAGGQLGASPVELTCVECHNPHGNGQYRILKPVPGIDATSFGAQVTQDVVGTYDLMDYIKTDTQNAFVVNDAVKFTAPGAGSNLVAGTTYYVRSAPTGFLFTVSATLGGAVFDVGNSTGGTVVRTAGGVADSPVDPDGDGGNPTKNYTIMETKGSQGMNASFLLYARDVTATGGTTVAAIASTITSTAASNWITTSAAHGLTVGDLVALTGVTGIADGTYTVSAVQSDGTVYNQFKVFGQTATVAASLTGTATRQAITGNFTSTGGDYFRRAIPWNPALVNPACDNSTYGASGTLIAAACGTMNQAPNGRPAAIISGTGVPTSIVGQKAFLDEMSTWCAACHTRYYSASNENIGVEPVISPVNASVTIAAGASNFIGASSPAFGDKVTFSGMSDAGLNSGEYYVIYTASGGVFRVTAVVNGLQGAAYTATLATTTGGLVTRTYQSSNSSWGYPRYDGVTEDATYKYQHSTASNRACTVCHVGHGSNAVMTGEGGTTFSTNFPYPTSGAANLNDSSRLLKVDNRGTCQMCHDPTGTVPAGTSVGAGNTSVP